MYVAMHKYARMSAQKIRPFADLIRGETADSALNILRYHPNRGARMIEKVLKSALANAHDRRAHNPSGLIVIEVRIDGGPLSRRWRAKSRGASTTIIKRTSHISVELG